MAHPILIAGEWQTDTATETFTATNPRTRERLPDTYPVSGWTAIDSALAAATNAAAKLRALPDLDARIATFLETYAANIEASAEALVTAAAAETALPATPRLASVELPRTTNQLRQAAVVAREGAWRRPTIDAKNNIRSCYAPIGPVWTIGPNNFPFAFNGISGGDFAAAIASGNPVIAKAHPLHPTTSRLLAEAAHKAASSAGLPPGTVQMLYHMAPAGGLRLVRDPRLAAVAFTGSREGGLKLKAAADAAGKLFFGEMSSVNPTVLLPGAIAEDVDGLATQLATSILMGTGQFCTKPGLVVLLKSDAVNVFMESVATKLKAAPSGVLFSAAGESSIGSAIKTLRDAGAESLANEASKSHEGFGVPNTLLCVSGKQFLTNPRTFQTEAFGNAALIVVAEDLAQSLEIIATLDGNLTGTIYSAKDGNDDAAYDAVAAALRPKVGRLINDKMPTGVAVSPAMNHGGPYPATSQPHFTAVGLPAAVMRFTQLQCYDNVRQHRLPACLRD